MFHRTFIAQKALKSSISFFTLSRNFTTINQRTCHYEVLGVKPTAELPEIKKAFYDKAKLYHPDTNKEENAEETFKIITKAYETLKDPISRQIYDLSKSNPNFNQDMESGGAEGSSAYSKYYTNNAQSNGQATDYYNNKWYGYGSKKPGEESIRDEYANVRTNLAKESIFDNMVLRVSIVIGTVIVYDLWQRYKTGKHNQFVDVQKQLLRGTTSTSGVGALDPPLVFIKESPSNKSQENSQVIDLRDYIDERKEKVQREDDNNHNEF